MIDIRLVSKASMGQTVELLRDEMLARGWSATQPYEGSAHILVTRKDGKKMHIFSATPPTTSYAMAHLVDDKFATYQLLKESGVPQLDTIKVKSSESRDLALQFLKSKGLVVVKPIDSAHGKGITVNVTNKAELEEAIDVAIKSTKNIRSALVQQQYDYETIHDLRMLCIDYKFVGAIQRVPARVFGDGVHTVRKLIEIENRKEIRGKPYHAVLATISPDKAAQYLKEKIDQVPLSGQEVQVLGIANYGAGGETVDVTDNIPDWLVKYAQKAAKMCEMPVAGVDFMLAKSPESHHTPDDLDVALTEVNKAPSLAIHNLPTTGKPRNVVGIYVDYLASLS